MLRRSHRQVYRTETEERVNWLRSWEIRRNLYQVHAYLRSHIRKLATIGLGTPTKKIMQPVSVSWDSTMNGCTRNKTTVCDDKKKLIFYPNSIKGLPPLVQKDISLASTSATKTAMECNHKYIAEKSGRYKIKKTAWFFTLYGTPSIFIC